MSDNLIYSIIVDRPYTIRGNQFLCLLKS